MALWTPANLATPAIAWFSPKDSTTVTQNATNNVTRIANKQGAVGPLQDFNGDGSQTPVYSPNGFGSGYPAVTFNGSSYLRSTGNTFNGPVYHAFGIAQVNALGSSANCEIVTFGDGANYDWNSPDRCVFLWTSNDNTYNVQAETNNTNVNIVTASQAISASTPFIFQSIQNRTAGTETLAINTVAGAASTTVNTNLNSTQLSYGSGCTSFATAPLTGLMGDLIVLNYTPSQSDLQNIEGYLAWSINRPDLLPSNHPYRNAAPTSNRATVTQVGAVGVSTLAMIAAMASVSFGPNSRRRLWVPSDLATPPLKWVDAQAASTITQASNVVSSWGNKGSDGVAFTQATAGSRPSYNATGLNGKPAVVWDTTPRLLQSATTMSATTVSVFAIASLVSGTTGKRLVSLNAGDVDYNNDSYAAIIKSDSTGTSTNIERNGFQLNNTVPITSPCLINNGFDGTNGFSTVNVTTTVQGAKTGTLAPTMVTLGDYYFGGNPQTDNWVGALGEMVLLNYVPSTADRQKLEGYLLWRWGLQALIPAGHPYVNDPPTTGATRVIFLTSGTSWVVPADWSGTNTLQAIGGGGGGRSAGGGGGGGGGAYATISNITLTAGTTATYAIGAGGTRGTAGGDTTFGSTVILRAKGGATTTTTTGGAGGAAASCLPTAGAFSGGAGGAGLGSSTTGTGGGGGGAAGPGGAGGAGASGGSGTSTVYGGGGGSGAGKTTAGGNGTAGTTAAGAGGTNGTGGGPGGAGGAGTGVTPTAVTSTASADFVSTHTSANPPVASVAGASTGGGGGGAGSSTTNNAAGSGSGYGGGGGGAGNGTPTAGGVGSNGLIVVTYVASTTLAVSPVKQRRTGQFLGFIGTRTGVRQARHAHHRFRHKVLPRHMRRILHNPAERLKRHGTG